MNLKETNYLSSSSSIMTQQNIWLPAKTNTIPSSLDKKITSLQRFIRMYNISSQVILPSDISPFLKETLTNYSKEECTALGYVISKQSIEIRDNPKLFQEEGVRLRKWSVCYIDSEKKENVLPMTIWLQLSENRQKLRIQLYGKKIPNAEGSYKYYKESSTIIVSLTCGNGKQKSLENTVLARSKTTLTPDDEKELSIEKYALWIEDELEMLQDSFNLFKSMFSPDALTSDPNIKIAGIPSVTRPYKGKTRKKLEWEDKRFTSDLENASEAEFIKLNFSNENVIPFSFRDSLDIACSMHYTISKMHLKGIVHRDLKRKNILLQYNPNLQKTEGFLTDFDLVAKFGAHEAEDIYVYWDLCSQNGIVLPTTDLFSLVLMVAEAYFGKAVREITNDKKKRLKINIKDHFLNKFMSKNLESLFSELEKSGISSKIIQSWKILFLSIDEPLSHKLVTTERLITSMVKAMPSKRKRINQYLAEVRTAEEVLILLSETYQVDQTLYRYIISNEGSKLIAELSNNNISPEKKQQIIQNLYDKFPFYKNLGQRIQNIKQLWDSHSNI